MAFRRYRALPQGEVTVEEFRAWLGQFDGDGDGRISREELQRALRSLNLWFAWWRARAGVRAADANRDGAVDGDDEVRRLFAFAQRHLHVKIAELGASYY
uniref:EF-hand domain-containing protein n=1 Tax=Oryza punctata TaxID=4537 RepID=A0A0E0L998_ORYPU